MKIKRCVEHKSNSNEKKIKSILPLKGSDLNTNPSRLMSCNYKNQIRIYLLFTFPRETSCKQDLEILRLVSKIL